MEQLLQRLIFLTDIFKGQSREDTPSLTAGGSVEAAVAQDKGLAVPRPSLTM